MKIISKFSCMLLATMVLASCGRNNMKDKYPNYVEDLNTIEYSFNDKEVQDPFWLGNVMYNESVLMFQKDGSEEISGNLLFVPKKIISVKDYSLKKDYIEGTDYKVEGRKIILLNKSIEYRTEKEVNGSASKQEYASKGYVLGEVSQVNTIDHIANMGGTIYTESKFYYGASLWVTYAYDINDIENNKDIFPKYDLSKLPKIKDKLDKKENLKIVGLGDSVLEGCSASSKMLHEPYQKSFFDMMKDGLERLYGINVTIDNQAVGGKDASWGQTDVVMNKVIESKPDLFIVHFGINDLGAGHSTMIYYNDIETIVLKVKQALPDVSILLMSPFFPYTGLYDESKMEEYADTISDLENTEDNVKFFDMYRFSRKLAKLGEKSYYDFGANGVNHVNDFASRIYLQTLLNLFYDFNNKK